MERETTGIITQESSQNRGNASTICRMQIGRGALISQRRQSADNQWPSVQACSVHGCVGGTRAHALRANEEPLPEKSSVKVRKQMTVYPGLLSTACIEGSKARGGHGPSRRAMLCGVHRVASGRFLPFPPRRPYCVVHFISAGFLHRDALHVARSLLELK